MEKLLMDFFHTFKSSNYTWKTLGYLNVLDSFLSLKVNYNSQKCTHTPWSALRKGKAQKKTLKKEGEKLK